MSVDVTRSYLRTRLVAALAGFGLVILAGTGVMLWQVERAKEIARSGAVISSTTAATGDIHAQSPEWEQMAASPGDNSEPTWAEDPRDRMTLALDMLQTALLTVAGLIIAGGALIGLAVLLPMTRNIASAHETMKAANAEAEKARKRAETADRAKADFLATMSHEIRTPMNGVLAMTELLDRTALDDRQKMFTEVIARSGNTLMGILNDILDISRIDTGQIVLSASPFRLSDVIEDVATTFSPSAVENGLELIVRIEPRLRGQLRGDAERIRQVLANLVGNAVKFSDSGHVLIDVSGKVRNGTATIVVQVEDTGIGIPRDQLDRVFETFTQTDSGPTRRRDGAGLGLAIASRLVRLMDGRIGVESEVGRGSVFRLEIPLKVIEASTADPAIPAELSGARVLVIDDNPVARRVLVEQLRNWGLDCAASESGQVGLDLMRRAAQLGAWVDCVIVDRDMPEMSGVEVAEAIGSDPTLRAPVVLMTPIDDDEAATLAESGAIAASLVKPVRPGALLEALIGALGATPRPKRKEPAVSAPASAVAVPEVRQPVRRAKAVVTRLPLRLLDVLLIKEEETDQSALGPILEGLGLSYRIARSAAQGVDMHGTRRPRLVLIDLSMADEGGIDAAAAIRAREAGTGLYTPIVGIAAYWQKGHRNRCMASGMDDYLVRPVAAEMLAARITAWLQDEPPAQQQVA